MELSANEKIKNLLDELGVSQAEFSRQTGISTANIANLVNVTKTLSSDILKNIKDAYPEVNLNYLIMGSGQPLLNAEEVEVEIYRRNEQEDVEKYIAGLKEEIQELQQKLNTKRKLLTMLRAIDPDINHDAKKKN